MRTRINLLTCVLLLGGSLSAQPPRIVFVDVDAQGSNTGTSWQNAFTNLRIAIGTAQPGDQLWVAEGTYFPGTTRNQSFGMKNGVSIYGGFRGVEVNIQERDWLVNRTILSGDIGSPGNRSDNCYHVVSNVDPLDTTALLDGFVITGGQADGAYPHDQGGGLLNINASPQFSNCIFEENQAYERGGGAANISGAPTYNRCLFRWNDAFGGGGMLNYQSSPKIVACEFIGNTGAYHGGMWNDVSSSPEITNCTFMLNLVYDSGGAMGIERGSAPQIRDCVFRANIAEYGSAGAVWHYYNGISTTPRFFNCLFEANYGCAIGTTNSAPRLEACVFVDNLSSMGASGAGLYVEEDSAPVLVNCTFSGNASSLGGNAIACRYNPARPSRVIIVNSILFDGGEEVLNENGSTIVVAYSDIQGGYPGVGNLNVDPHFVNVQMHDFHLRGASPVIDRGTAFFAWNDTTIVDLDSTQYSGVAPDMGAFEWTPTSNVEDEASSVPSCFALVQNYPNPFNPTTTIRYGLPQTSFVTLTVYNTLGQQVAQLVNEQQQAGYHDVVFRGDGLASGVYFYRIQAGSFIDVKKLILLK